MKDKFKVTVVFPCDFEDDAYGTCILDIFKDYHSLIGHFTKLNSAINHFINGVHKDEDLIFLKENSSITPVSVEIGVQLFCQDEVKRKEITKKLLRLFGLVMHRVRAEL